MSTGSGTVSKNRRRSPNYTEEMPDELRRSKIPDRGGSRIWLSRKGAIDATEGKPGLIPGSMGTASYVVTGKGNPLSLNSSPHGAGRSYSRSKARKTFTREHRGGSRGVEALRAGLLGRAA